MRVYEYAKEQGLASKEILEILEKLNIEVSSHLAVLSDDDLESLNAYFNSNQEEITETPDISLEEQEEVSDEEDIDNILGNIYEDFYTQNIPEHEQENPELITQETSIEEIKPNIPEPSKRVEEPVTVEDIVNDDQYSDIYKDDDLYDNLRIKSDYQSNEEVIDEIINKLDQENIEIPEEFEDLSEIELETLNSLDEDTGERYSLEEDGINSEEAEKTEEWEGYVVLEEETIDLPETSVREKIKELEKEHHIAPKRKISMPLFRQHKAKNKNSRKNKNTRKKGTHNKISPFITAIITFLVILFVWFVFSLITGKEDINYAQVNNSNTVQEVAEHSFGKSYLKQLENKPVAYFEGVHKNELVKYLESLEAYSNDKISKEKLDTQTLKLFTNIEYIQEIARDKYMKNKQAGDSGNLIQNYEHNHALVNQTVGQSLKDFMVRLMNGYSDLTALSQSLGLENEKDLFKFMQNFLNNLFYVEFNYVTNTPQDKI